MKIQKPGKMDEIVTYCAHGRRGGIAQETLQALGYSNVKNMTGGLTAFNSLE